MPESDTIDIRTLTIYVRACEEQNLTRCAEAMDLPKTTVSKAITRLESRLGLKLLERSTRKVQITEEGQVVLERARMLLTDFRSLTEDALSMATEPRGLLRVAAPPILGDYFSSHVAPAFLQKWPRVSIALSPSYSFDDLFSQSIDLAFRVGQVADDRLIARKFGQSTRIIAASPDFLSKEAAIEQPKDLSRVNCLRFTYNSQDSDWTLTDGRNTTSVPVRGNYFCPNIHALKHAAASGLGVAQLPIHAVEAEIAAGTLEHVMPAWHVPPLPIYLVYKSGSSRPRRLQALLDHLIENKALFDFLPY
ncbi:LysR family transcriptional regulator [Roseibium alexandrii]|uniref:D-malate degradation protein R n=1 Tax=Roseibium alexandrii TaxID=388408 RepID=A0A0M7A941_9HYPH|nr:LysR family transcriptional regulator [Roseibium alexandrii]CTQ71389.1 D-malate degradation protein R [Roseibium alexandrii]